MEDLDSAGTTPEFVVGIEEMEEVQRAITNSLATGDNVLIGARLESLEKEIKDRGTKIGTASTAPVSLVQVNDSSNNAPSIVVSDMSKHSFANIAARPVVLKSNGIKQRSNSQKRGSDDEEGFNIVKKKKQGRACSMSLKGQKTIMKFSSAMWRHKL